MEDFTTGSRESRDVDVEVVTTVVLSKLDVITAINRMYEARPQNDLVHFIIEVMGEESEEIMSALEEHYADSRKAT